MHKKQTNGLNNKQLGRELDVYTCAAMREAEQAAFRAGQTGVALMERAGRALGAIVAEQAACTARIAVVAGSGDLPATAALAALAALPAVMSATYLARRWPLPVSPGVMRRIVFLLLLVSGLSLAAPAAIHLFEAA